MMARKEMARRWRKPKLEGDPGDILTSEVVGERVSRGPARSKIDT